MIVTTTPSIEGRTIQQYLGIVAGEAIMGANVVRDFLAGITDIVGGRSGAYEEKLVQAREIAMQELTREAARLGAERRGRNRSRLRGDSRRHVDGHGQWDGRQVAVGSACCSWA